MNANDFKKRNKKAQALIQQDSNAIHCQYFQPYTPLAMTPKHQPTTIKMITTPLHEAILNGSPEWVEFLCRQGADVNLNPAKGSSKPNEYGFSPLELALNPNCIIFGRYRINHPQIIKILLHYKATCSDGSIPNLFTHSELDTLYKSIYKLIQEAASKTKLHKLKLIILLPEIHNSKYSLLLETIIFFIAGQFKIKFHFLESSKEALDFKKRYDTWYSVGAKPCAPDPRDFSTNDYTLPLSSSFNMKPVAVDLYRFEDINESTISARNYVMAETTAETKKSGVWIVGATHLQGLLERSEGSLINKSYVALFFPIKKFLVLAINITPHLPNTPFGTLLDYPFNSRKVAQIKVPLKGEAELMTGEEILEAVRDCDYRVRLEYIDEGFKNISVEYPQAVVETMNDFLHFALPKKLPNLKEQAELYNITPSDDDAEIPSEEADYSRFFDNIMGTG